MPLPLSEIAKPFRDYQELYPSYGLNALTVVNPGNYRMRSDQKGEYVPDGIYHECESALGLTRVERAVAGASLAASPHITTRVPTKKLKEWIRQQRQDRGEGGTVPLLPHNFGQDGSLLDNDGEYPNVPAHFTAFMWEQERPSSPLDRLDYYRLAKMPPDEQDAYFRALMQTALKVYGVFQKIYADMDFRVLNKLPAERILPVDELMRHNTPMFYLVGFSDLTTQLETGLNRGCQSNPDFHMHILAMLYNYSQYTIQSVDPSVMAKQIGAFDSLFYPAINSLLEGEITFEDRRFAVEGFEDYGSPQYPYRRPFFHGHRYRPFHPSCPEGFEYTPFPIMHRLSAQELLFQNEVYNAALECFLEYYKLLGRHNDQQAVRAKFRERVMEVYHRRESALRFRPRRSFEDGLNLLERNIFDILRPTRRQIDALLSNPDQLSRESKTLLTAMRDRMQARRDAILDSQKRLAAARRLAQRFGLDEPGGFALIEIIHDRVRTKEDLQLKRPSLTMPGRYSATILSEPATNGGDPLCDHAGNLLVAYHTLSCRVGSQKGVVEDMHGVVLQR